MLALVQSDDVLDVVAVAPSVTTYFALMLRIIERARYVGGLAAAGYRQGMLAALRSQGLSFVETDDRLFLRAERKDSPERRPAAPAPTEGLPDWVAEHAVPWISLAQAAWHRVLGADDGALMRAFEACVKDLVEGPELGRVIELPEVGGLHHRYVREAA